MTNLRSIALLALGLFGVNSACSSELDAPRRTAADAGAASGARAGNGPAGAGAGGAAGEGGAASEPVGKGDGGATGEAGAGGGGESGSGGDDGEVAGSGTGGAGGASGGAGPGSPGTICEQAISYLTDCGQLEGAGEAGQNCDPDNPASQCVVPCLLAKPCQELSHWPQPIIACVNTCSI